MCGVWCEVDYKNIYKRLQRTAKSKLFVKIRSSSVSYLAISNISDRRSSLEL